MVLNNSIKLSIKEIQIDMNKLNKWNNFLAMCIFKSYLDKINNKKNNTYAQTVVKFSQEELGEVIRDFINKKIKIKTKYIQLKIFYLK